MKLLYITNGVNGSGGLERVLSIKASNLAENHNVEVHILVLNDGHRNPFYSFSSKIKWHSVTAKGRPWNYILGYRKGMQAVVDTVIPDIICVCDDGLKAFFIPQFLKTKAKIIYERHVSKLIEMRDDFGLVKRFLVHAKWRLMEKLARRFHRFIVLTNGNKKEWSSLDNVEVIANPLSFYPDNGSLHEQKIVLCVGKISYQKGQDLLVKAWDIVHNKYPDWELHMYGKENLSVLDTNNLSKNMKFFLPEKNIEEKYLESSIYVMSSRFEGFGMVLIEAMACGVPCVSFNCDYGPADIIRHEIDGYIVEKENSIELANAILALIDDHSNCKQMGNQARIRAKEFDIEPITRQWQELFNSLLYSS